ncbi:MAG: hypothetical protein IJR06_05120 [Paludibacteraceae bacterium]|nr:hypothetical protein [Paludibacteraceae bacterium]
MKILKLTFAAVAALLLTSCLTKAILSTVVVDKKTAEVRAYGDRFIVNVKCAVTVKVTVDAKAKDWIHVSDTKFNPGLGDGYNLEVITDASTYNYKTSGVITIAIDEESFAEVKVEREALDKDEVRDVEGHTYGVALINGKYWMTENLRSLTYDTKSEARGQNIRMVEDGTGFTGKACTDPSRLSDLGTMEGYKNSMGYLYNYLAAMGLTADEALSQDEGEYKGAKRQGICPNGFRLPTSTEFSSLKQYVDNQAGGSTKGGKWLKTSVGWDSSVGNGSDGCGFRGYPCGVYKDGAYVKKPGFRTSFWASTSYHVGKDSQTGSSKWCMGLPQTKGPDLPEYNTTVVVETGHYESEGMSVRCVKE